MSVSESLGVLRAAPNGMEWKKRIWTSGSQPGGRTYSESVLVPVNGHRNATATQPSDDTRAMQEDAGTGKVKRPLRPLRPLRRQVPQPMELADSQLHHVVLIKHIPGKGNGVFAKVALECNTRMRYTGKDLDEKQVTELYQLAQADGKNEHRYLDYLCDTGDSGRSVDAHPRHNLLSIAGQVNEPSPSERANMALSHGGKVGSRYPVLIVTSDINAGEELLVHYGKSFVRNYDVAQPSALPWWWMKRNRRKP